MAKKINEQDVRSLLSYNVKRLRHRENLSQLTLAHKVGLTHNFINDIENSKKGVSARTIARLSNVLNVEPYQLFLPKDLFGNEMESYLKDFNNHLLRFVSDFSQSYITKSSNGTTGGT